MLIAVPLLALFLAATWYLFGPNSSLTQTPHGRIATGQQVFQANCASCHGLAATGQDPARPMGGLDANDQYIAPALNGTGHAWHHAPRELRQVITEGSFAQGSPMRGFKERLSPEEIEAVLSYFQSLWPQEIKKRYEQTFRE